MLGAVHSQTLGIALFLTGVLFFLLGRNGGRNGERNGRVTMDFVGWTFLGLIALTAFQLVPLPQTFVRTISPAAFELRRQTMEITGASLPTFMPLTVDIPATALEMAKLFCYLAIYWTTKSVAEKGSTRFVLQAISVLGFVCAVIFIGHKITMTDSVYGFYSPVHKMPGDALASAPFINPNHMAAFLGLCAFVSIGLAMSGEERKRRPWLITVGVFTGGAMFLTLSRGGIAAFVTGQLIFVTMILLRNTVFKKSERPMESGRLAWLPIGLAMSMGLGMAAMGDAIVGEYVNGDVSKLGIWKESLPLMRMFPLVGAGRGGFVSVFPLVSDWTAAMRFSYAENIVVQILVDYGLVFGPIVLAAFLVAVGRRILGIPVRPTTMSMVAALIALGMHNIVDFNLEIPGVAVVAMALLAVLTVSNPRARRTRRLWHASFPKTGPFILAAMGFLFCVALLASLPQKQMEAEEDRAEAALAQNDGDYFGKENLSRVFYRHPGDYYIAFLSGLYHNRSGQQSPLPYWGRAVELNSHAAAPHYHIGKFLLTRGYIDQAMMEFRLAGDRDERYIELTAQQLVNAVSDTQRLMAWPVTTAQKARFFDALSIASIQQGHPANAAIFDKQNLALKKTAPGALHREAQRLARADSATALKLADRLGAISGRKTEALILKAEIYRENGDLPKAISLLAPATGEKGPQRGVLKRLSTFYVQNGQFEDAMRTVEKMVALSETVPLRIGAVCHEGDLKLRAGKIHAALDSYKRALAMDPDNVRVLKRILRTARQLNDETLLLEILGRLQHLEPDEEKWRSESEKLQNRIKIPEI